VTIYLIDIHDITHTCPADPEPHTIDSRRRIVHVTPGRPCLTPVTIHSANDVATIPCSRNEPSERQCANCRTIITVRHHTAEFRGYQGPEPKTARPATGIAPHPCDVCHRPLAAVLADSGRHILCQPRRTPRPVAGAA
jgi:hypothetical protein